MTMTIRPLAVFKTKLYLAPALPYSSHPTGPFQLISTHSFTQQFFSFQEADLTGVNQSATNIDSVGTTILANGSTWLTTSSHLGVRVSGAANAPAFADAAWTDLAGADRSAQRSRAPYTVTGGYEFWFERTFTNSGSSALTVTLAGLIASKTRKGGTSDYIIVEDAITPNYSLEAGGALIVRYVFSFLV